MPSATEISQQRIVVTKLTTPQVVIEEHGEDVDARRIGSLYRDASKSQVAAVKSYLQCGQQLIAKKAALGHGKWSTWLADNAKALGFGGRAARAMMAAAAKWQSTAEVTPTLARKISREMWGNSGEKSAAASTTESGDGPAVDYMPDPAAVPHDNCPEGDPEARLAKQRSQAPLDLVPAFKALLVRFIDRSADEWRDAFNKAVAQLKPATGAVPLRANNELRSVDGEETGQPN